MKYFKSTVEYLFKYDSGKRFLTVFLLTLVPSLALGFAFPFSGYFDLLFSLKNSSFEKFGDFWLFSFRHDVLSLCLLAAAFVLFVFFAAYIVTMITRSVRVGEFRFTKVIHSINDNFFPAIAIGIFYTVSIFVAHNLFVVLAFFFMQIKSRALGVALSVIAFVGLCVLTVYIWSSLTLWLPTMSFSGQYVTKALVNSFYKSRSYQRHFFLPSLMALAFTFVFGIIAHYAGKLWYINWLLNSLCYAVLFTFVLTFSSMAYCETESITREDMAKRYFGR